MTKETYLRSVDVLLDAYNSGTLFHGNCSHCAVGNLLGCDLWGKEFLTARDENYQTSINIDPEMENVYAEKGFTREELMKIEFVFEMAIKPNYNLYISTPYKKQGQYLGLCAVLKVMVEMVEEPVNSELSLNRLNIIAQKFNVVI